MQGTTGFGEEKPVKIQGDTHAGFETIGLNGYLKGQRPGAGLIQLTAEQRGAETDTYTRIYREANGETLDGPPLTKEGPPIQPGAAGKPGDEPPVAARNR